MAGLGPLTTTFTPASGCNSVISGIVFTQTLDGGNTTTHKYHSLGLSATSECYPPGFEVNSNAYYSPGICPSGWQSACGRQEAIGGSITETRVTCCPTGYRCIDAPNPTETWSTLSCSSSAISAVSVTVPDESNQYYKVTVLNGPVIHAAAVEVRWQRSDFIAPSTQPPSSSSISSTSTTSSPPISSSSAIVTETTSNSSPESASPGNTSSENTSPENISLSTGAKVGIGVGAGCLVLTMLAIGLWWKRKRDRTKKASLNANDIGPQIVHQETPKTPAELWEQYQQELYTSSNVPEMVTESNRHEFTGESRPAELPVERWR
ncbi:hypothetical protein F4820DRAFT_139341 [Hypoxylon rubiginosum]|uniref:Uncharacterized protein n=1 Tax=Hypoxylon rubiginosum TaxID=110542 RepID=A0ACB9YLJ7_9PEZI|nr:hypothetical protein F4820DRAFT_139341 [Hypoxylon rubiginosum]